MLVVGRELVKRIAFLRKYSIPEPVAGGLVAAVLVAAFQAAGVRIGFDNSLQPGLMLAFFATIGLGADARMIAKGGGALLRFTVCVIGMLVLENVIGVGVAKALGIDPLIGLIAGSVTMAGGHGRRGMGPALRRQFGLVEGPALALASATFGLIMGGVIGGPVAMRLIRRLQARGEALGVAAERHSRMTRRKPSSRSRPSD